MKIRYEVTLSLKEVREGFPVETMVIQAEGFSISSGALAFLDEDGQVTEAFGPNAWKSVRRKA